MRNLITFLVKNSSWFFFIFLEVICFYFIFNYNSYQRSIYLNSSNEIVGRVYLVSGNIKSFFGLRQNNQELLARNGELKVQIWELENYIQRLESDSITTRAFVKDSLHKINYEFIISRVINNSVSRIDNYITIDKGTKDGIAKEMGVISQQGIVGIVRAVSPNFAVIQPVLNPKSILSCKVKNSNAPGSLVWDTKDYRYASLEDFPRFEKFVKGDTIITSGFSSIFPEGIIVGTVVDSKSQNDDNFYTLKVKLSTNFTSLSDVMVIKNRDREEQSALEKEVMHGQ